ncbi:MAG TPA: AAA family ATPase, partial [Bacillales bacterium]|nr:AAA family ATPase [Bacillales bacterium]
MKIRKIEVDHYGCFTNWHLNFPHDGMHVVYGLNETGKSTIMRFIADVLFGFSTKSPGISEAGTLYGGRITLEDPDRGPIVIERAGNKGRGNMKIQLADGTDAGEEMIGKLLPGLDEHVFRAIFCFDLDGLQGLERIGADEMNDYLFHAGMSGDLAIRTLERKLEKQSEDRYKPKGRKPELNRRLSELESLDREVREWQRKNDGYNELVKSIERIRNRIDEIQERKAESERQIRHLEKRKAVAPFVKERQACELGLNRLPVSEPFPEDGL